MTKWQVLGSIFNSVHFAPNFITCRFFASWASFYTQIKFSITIASIYGVLSKMEYI